MAWARRNCLPGQRFPIGAPTEERCCRSSYHPFPAALQWFGEFWIRITVADRPLDRINSCSEVAQLNYPVDCLLRTKAGLTTG